MTEPTTAEIREWRENKFNCINGYSAKYMSLLLDRLEEAEALLPIWNSEMITQYDRGENLCGDKISDCMDDLKHALTGET